MCQLAPYRSSVEGKHAQRLPQLLDAETIRRPELVVDVEHDAVADLVQGLVDLETFRKQHQLLFCIIEAGPRSFLAVTTTNVLEHDGDTAAQVPAESF